MEERGIGTGTCEGDADTAGGFDDAGRDLEQPQADSRELGGAEGGGCGHSVPHGPHQPVGGGVKDEPHLIGVGRAAGGSVALQLRFMQLDQVFSLAAGAVESVIDPFSAALGKGGDNKADVEAKAARLDASNDATFGRPEVCGLCCGTASSSYLIASLIASVVAVPFRAAAGRQMEKSVL